MRGRLAVAGGVALALVVWVAGWLRAPSTRPATSPPPSVPEPAPSRVAPPRMSPDPVAIPEAEAKEEPARWEKELRARAARAAEDCDLDLLAVDCHDVPCVSVWRGVGQGTLRRCASFSAEVDPAFAYLRLWVVDDARSPAEAERLLVYVDYPAGSLADEGPYAGGAGDRLTDAAAWALDAHQLRLRTPDEVLDAELRRVLDITDGEVDHPAVDAVLRKWSAVDW